MSNKLLRDELAQKEGAPYNDTKNARILAFINGWDAAEENCKADWFKSGGMAERILIDWDIKQLKEKLDTKMFKINEIEALFDSAILERDELERRCKALEERIRIITEKYDINA